MLKASHRIGLYIIKCKGRIEKKQKHGKTKKYRGWRRTLTAYGGASSSTVVWNSSMICIFFFTELGVLLWVHQGVYLIWLAHLYLYDPPFLIWAPVYLIHEIYLLLSYPHFYKCLFGRSDMENNFSRLEKLFWKVVFRQTGGAINSIAHARMPQERQWKIK